MRDIDTIDSELVLSRPADRRERAAQGRAGGEEQGPEAIARRDRAQRRSARRSRRAGPPARARAITKPEAIEGCRGIGLITVKPQMFIANVDDDDVLGEGELAKMSGPTPRRRAPRSCPSARKVESELAELDEEDKAEMLADYGIAEPALNSLARPIYDLLGLQSFYTAGPKEIRAWPVRAGLQGAAGRGRDPHRLRAGLHPRRDLLGRRPGGVQDGEGDQGGGRMRIEGKDYTCTTRTCATSCSTCDRAERRAHRVV
jgi:ribosome-binding ATPase YchF (GTP1/OBG family)